MLSNFTLAELAKMITEPGAAVVVTMPILSLSNGDIFYWDSHWFAMGYRSSYRMKDNLRIDVTFFVKNCPFHENGVHGYRDAFVTQELIIPRDAKVLVRQFPGITQYSEKLDTTGYITCRKGGA